MQAGDHRAAWHDQANDVDSDLRLGAGDTRMEPCYRGKVEGRDFVVGRGAYWWCFSGRVVVAECRCGFEVVRDRSTVF